MLQSPRIGTSAAAAEAWHESGRVTGLRVNEASKDDSDFNVGEILTVVRNNLWSILLWTLLGLAIGVAFVVLKKPTYASQTQILVEPRSRTAVDTSTSTGLPQNPPDPGLMESQEKILRSYAVVSRVVTQEKLADDPEFSRSKWEWLTRLVKIGPFRDKRSEAERADAAELNAIQTFVQQTYVKRTSTSYVIDAEVQSEDPAKAARLARALAEAYLLDQSETKSGEARQANAMLDSRLGDMREKVRLADTAVEDFRLRNGLLLATGSLVNEQQLAQMNTGLVQAQAATAEARARYERMQRLVESGGVPDTINESFNSAVVQKLRDQYAALAQREAALGSRLQAGHPDMIDIRSRLTALRGQLDAELRRILAGARSEYEIARSREAQYVERTEAIKRETNEKNQARVQLAALEREQAAVRKQLETFMSREHDTREQQQLFTPDARIISPALVPNRPSAPSKPIALILSLLGGLGAGLAHALLRAQMDRTVRTADGVERGAGLRFIVALPAYRQSRVSRLVHLGSKQSRLEGASDAFVKVLESISLKAAHGADPYRSGVTRLAAHLRSARKDAPARCVMIVSPSAGDGKSCLALGLAQAEAQSGIKTLLVDADFRNPDLSTVFAPRAAQEARRDDLEAASFASMVYGFDDADADLLPLSAIILSLGRQMRLKQMVAGLAKLMDSYDRIIIDGGALLDDGIATSLSHLADQVVMVARHGKTQTVDLVDAARSMDIPVDPRSGVVLTMAPDSARSRG